METLARLLGWSSLTGWARAAAADKGTRHSPTLSILLYQHKSSSCRSRDPTAPPPPVSFPWSFLHPWVPTRRGWQASERADKLGQRDTAAEYFIALPALTFRSIELLASFNTSKAVQGGHRAALYVSAAKGNGQERSAQPDRAQQLALAPLLLGGFIRINLLPGRRSLLIAW